MQSRFWILFLKLQNLTTHEDGQDFTEYALILILIATALISGLKGMATPLYNLIGNINAAISTAL